MKDKKYISLNYLLRYVPQDLCLFQDRLILALPWIRRLMEYIPSITRIPARSGWIFSFVFSSAVIAPAPIPNRNESTSPKIQTTPCTAGSRSAAAVHTTAEIAAPVTMLPSTVRSGVFNVRNDKNTPQSQYGIDQSQFQGF